MERRSTSKKILLVLFIAGLVSFGYAQQPMKVGIVNAELVLQKSQEGKRVTAQLEAKNKTLQEDLVRLDDKIRDLETRLNTQRLTLSQEALSNLMADLDKQRTERTRFVEDSRRELNDLQIRLFNRLQGELRPIITEIGKEKNLDLIFDVGGGGIIYFNPAIDLTDEVIQKYDASKGSE
ncbi:MAG: OmpH family outer membrane protein [Candidatus Aminicenantes bacterium]|nr:MAG: OmpH family outer membrane protein [Candidatus Aminicenantes bacterium]